MAKTAIADIIIPTAFEKYAIERTAELSSFGQCGIIEGSPVFDELAAGGGRTVEMPFWKDLTATRQLLSDSASLTVNKITADKDTARIHNDAQAWSVNHLAKVISGDDPMQAIVDLVAEYWARTDEGLVVSCLKGIFAAGTMSGNLLAIHSESVAGQSSATRLTGATFVDATAKLGDRGDRLPGSQRTLATWGASRHKHPRMHAPPSKVEPRTGPQAKRGQQPSPEAQPRSRKPSQPKLTQQQLEAHLWGAANILRGKTAGLDYKNYILSLMFFKRLCDQWAREADEAIAEVEKQQGMELNDRQRAVFRKRGEHRFSIPQGSQWGDVLAASTNLGEVLTKAMRSVANANDELRGVFTVDLNQPAPDGSGKPRTPPAL
jgi:hypothetical protein